MIGSGQVQKPGPKPSQAEIDSMRAQGEAQARGAKMNSLISALRASGSSDEAIVGALLDGGFSTDEIAGRGFQGDLIARVEKGKEGSAYVAEAKVVAPKPEPKPGHPLFAPKAVAGKKKKN
ncbi:MAG: hypothetical protein JXA24_01460 [Proteobacteria bacterium]|nr:hypothetical protein [Pseudomonadota bacterium]